jgi:hypothetical protein
MRVPVTYESPTSLTAPGKIFYYNGYLFINELNTGIHVYDNHDPSNPRNVGFINIQVTSIWLYTVTIYMWTATWI